MKKSTRLITTAFLAACCVGFSCNSNAAEANLDHTGLLDEQGNPVDLNEFIDGKPMVMVVSSAT